MKISDLVINKINRFQAGYVFTYSDFDVPVNKVEALKKTLSRLVASGNIIRISKGQFYKPEMSEFGHLRPKEYQVVKDLLEQDNKLIGYLTGISIYNKLGLTTQVSNTIQIGSNLHKKPKRRGRYSIRFILQKNTITRENINLLQILDSIRFIKRIPDADVSGSCERLVALIGKLSRQELLRIAKLALKYNPGTRALTGAIIEKVAGSEITAQLLDSLNPVSVFSFNISDRILDNKQKWRIE